MLEETALIPFLGTFVRLLGAVPIPERAATLVTLEKAAHKALAHLGFLHFFPEGECWQWNQEIRPFLPGAFTLACRMGIPVIPLATVLRESRLFGRKDFRMLGRTFRLPPKVTIVVGDPLRPPASSAGRSSCRGMALAMSRRAREVMQASIDREGGSRGISRGMVPRLVRRTGEQGRASVPAAEDHASRAV
jgi:1-acyl-sn-glycerol-3-phosphate acyltransferase